MRWGGHAERTDRAITCVDGIRAVKMVLLAVARDILEKDKTTSMLFVSVPAWLEDMRRAFAIDNRSRGSRRARTI